MRSNDVLNGAVDLHRNALKRLQRMGIEVPASFKALKVRTDVVEKMVSFLLESGRFRHKAFFGKTNWSRAVMLFSRTKIVGIKYEQG